MSVKIKRSAPVTTADGTAEKKSREKKSKLMDMINKYLFLTSLKKDTKLYRRGEATKVETPWFVARQCDLDEDDEEGALLQYNPKCDLVLLELRWSLYENSSKIYKDLSNDKHLEDEEEEEENSDEDEDEEEAQDIVQTVCRWFGHDSIEEFADWANEKLKKTGHIEKLDGLVVLGENVSTRVAVFRPSVVLEKEAGPVADDDTVKNSSVDRKLAVSDALEGIVFAKSEDLKIEDLVRSHNLKCNAEKRDGLEFVEGCLMYGI